MSAAVRDVTCTRPPVPPALYASFFLPRGRRAPPVWRTRVARARPRDSVPVKNRRRRFDDDEPTRQARPAPGAAADLEAVRRDRRPARRRPLVHLGPVARPSTARGRIPAGSSPTSPPSTPSSASSRPARRPTSSCSSAACPARPVVPARGQALPRRRAPDVPPRRRLPRRAAGSGESRETRAMASRTAFGREAIAGQWANAEFGALAPAVGGRACRCPTRCRSSAPSCCWSSSATPDGTAAPRLAELRPDPADWPICGTSWSRHSRRWPGRLGPRRPVGVQPAGPTGRLV